MNLYFFKFAKISLKLRFTLKLANQTKKRLETSQAVLVLIGGFISLWVDAV